MTRGRRTGADSAAIAGAVGAEGARVAVCVGAARAAGVARAAGARAAGAKVAPGARRRLGHTRPGESQYQRRVGGRVATTGLPGRATTGEGAGLAAAQRSRQSPLLRGRGDAPRIGPAAGARAAAAAATRTIRRARPRRTITNRSPWRRQRRPVGWHHTAPRRARSRAAAAAPHGSIPSGSKSISTSDMRTTRKNWWKGLR